MTLLTNGIHSVNDWLDAWELSFSRQRTAVTQGLTVYDYNGTRPDYQAPSSEAPADHDWVIHSKVAVIDGKVVWIGTNNADPRSENINSELALVVENNPQLAQQLQHSIEQDENRSSRVTANGEYLNKVSSSEGCTREQVTPVILPSDKSFGAALSHDFLRIRNEIFSGQY